MREIKFRAWEKPTSEEWDKKRGISNVPEFGGQMLKMPLNNYFGLQRFFGYLDEEQHILMQYTGLKDKNGKEIYEGDVVNVTIRENIGTFNVPDDIIANGGYTGRDDVYEAEVIFKDFGFCINDKKMGEFYLQSMEDTFFEVIGNIYENPELLKERR